MNIDLDNILRIEDSRIPEVNSFEEYVKELKWLQRLLENHIKRCEYWESNEQIRPGLEKLHEFLNQFAGDRNVR